MASLRERWSSWLTNRRALHHVKRLESVIGRWRRQYQYNVEAALKGFNIRTLQDRRQGFDPIGGVGVVLTFIPAERKLYIHADADIYSRRLAQAMLVVHLAITHAGKPWETLSPYTVGLTDLVAKEGPANNEMWMEYMQAIDLLLPLETFDKIRRECIVHGYQRQTTYVLMRVMLVSQALIRRRVIDSVQTVDPVSTVTTVQDLLNLSKSRTVHVNTTAQHHR